MLERSTPRHATFGLSNSRFSSLADAAVTCNLVRRNACAPSLIGAHDAGKVHRKLRVVLAQPLFRWLRFGTEALHREPELGGGVWDSQAHDFVRNEVAKHKIGCEDDAPIARQVPERRAVAPLRSLAHYVDLTGSLLECAWSTQARIHNGGMFPVVSGSSPVRGPATRRSAARVSR